jgi:allantoicase
VTLPFFDLIDLASERLGSAVVSANDEFFGPKERLIAPDPPVWRESEYTEHGKWMDGWETRRRREAGYDWCIVRFGVPGILRAVDVETTHFKGNVPEACAIDVCDCPPDLADAAWHEILSRTVLRGDDHNVFAIEGGRKATHVRLRIFPDGGVARLRAYGEVVADWAALKLRGQVDLAAAEHGGRVVGSSDMFFGSRHNLILPGDVRNMGDGWETKRRRGPGHDWTIVRLGARGVIERIEVDTRHFKGNAPGACSLDGVRSEEPGAPADNAAWRELLPRAPLQPHARHTFERGINDIGGVTHVRFNIFPDGGVGRLRLFGRPR